jgi:quinol monooxygenase YgiN
MQDKIVLVSVLDPGTQKREAFLEEIAPLIWATRNQPGCLFFDLYCVVGQQSIFALHEIWGNYEDRQTYWQNVIGVQMNTLLRRYLAGPMEVFELEEVCL